MRHNFTSDFTFVNIPRGTVSAVAGVEQPNPHIDIYPTQLQDAHTDGRTPITWQKDRVTTGDTEEFLISGFHYLDSAMKRYWSDMRVPTRDAVRFIRTKVAGMRKSIQIWAEDLENGRVELPVISISRTSHSYNPLKFSPPYLPLRKRYVNSDMSRAALYYRPAPYNVDYTLSLWSNYKRDAEYILYQILTRFNPLAEMRITDDHTVGNVQMLFKSSSDVSDKEIDHESIAKVKYEISYTAEAWLSLPEQIVPTILGTVQTTEIVNHPTLQLIKEVADGQKPD